MSESTPVGKTKSAGWEIGLRRTLPISAVQAWALLMTQPGLGLWLGHGVDPAAFRKGKPYQTQEGTRGEIRSYSEGSLLRMTWQPSGWESASTLQIRVLSAKTGTTISFHHEKLADEDQRRAMLRHWSEVMDGLEKLAKPQP